jgi:hypothetical protein
MSVNDMAEESLGSDLLACKVVQVSIDSRLCSESETDCPVFHASDILLC